MNLQCYRFCKTPRARWTVDRNTTTCLGERGSGVTCTSPLTHTVYAWRHCLNRWILPNLGKKLVSEVGNGALRQFVETLSAAGLAAKTIINIVAVVKLVVASAVNEEGDEFYPRTWNYEFIQLPLVVKEKQNRPTITAAEISEALRTVRKRYAVLFACVAGTGLRIGEALAVRKTD